MDATTSGHVDLVSRQGWWRVLPVLAAGAAGGVLIGFALALTKPRVPGPA